MATDHIVLLVIGALGVVGGLWLLSEAKSYRRKRDSASEGRKHV
jgi:hypothetical protein